MLLPFLYEQQVDYKEKDKDIQVKSNFKGKLYKSINKNCFQIFGCTNDLCWSIYIVYSNCEIINLYYLFYNPCSRWWHQVEFMMVILPCTIPILMSNSLVESVLCLVFGRCLSFSRFDWNFKLLKIQHIISDWTHLQAFGRI